MFGKPIDTRLRQTFLTPSRFPKNMERRAAVRGMTSSENEGLVRQETPRAVAIGLGIFLTAFGSVFGGFPLWALIGILQEGGYSIGYMIVPTAIFGLFILIGSLVLFLGLKSLVAGITGQGLTVYVPEDRYPNGAGVDLTPQYISEEELLKQIHGTSNPGGQAITSTEEIPAPSTSAGFWGEIKPTDDEA
jgi:hypothetical protein